MTQAMNLVLPKQYVEIEQDEMMYLEGLWNAYKLAYNLMNFAVTGYVGTLLYNAGKIMLAAERGGTWSF